MLGDVVAKTTDFTYSKCKAQVIVINKSNTQTQVGLKWLNILLSDPWVLMNSGGNRELLLWSRDHTSFLTSHSLHWFGRQCTVSHPGPCIKAPYQQMLLVISLSVWQVNFLCNVQHIFKKLTKVLLMFHLSQNLFYAELTSRLKTSW